MVLGQCKDCKHWQREEDHPGFGYCSEINVSNANLSTSQKATIKIYQAIHGQIPDYLETHRDFGCTLFEMKTDEP